MCHSLKINRYHYLRSDESATDFAYAMALFRRGATENEVRFKLMEQRTDWKNHIGIKRKEAYLKRTIQRAKRLVDKIKVTT